MARKSKKNQARRNGGRGIPGWAMLLFGLGAGLLIAAIYLLRDDWGEDRSPLPRPDPEARPPAASVGEEVAPEARRTKYEFYDVLRDREVLIPDAELDAQARAEATAPPAPAGTEPAAESQVRYLLQAGAFRSATDAEALKARIALTGEVARVESAQIEGGMIHRVRLGPYPNAAALARAKQALAGHGIEAIAIKAQ
ncbi:MAG TPA: SPOR domain-containing protein [Arenimonas sp.]|nr:SPOR domain-containing protein [Arenimonas sp.]